MKIALQIALQITKARGRVIPKATATVQKEGESDIWIAKELSEGDATDVISLSRNSPRLQPKNTGHKAPTTSQPTQNEAERRPPGLKNFRKSKHFQRSAFLT